MVSISLDDTTVEWTHPGQVADHLKYGLSFVQLPRRVSTYWRSVSQNLPPFPKHHQYASENSRLIRRVHQKKPNGTGASSYPHADD